jgi:hypothetical protein
MKRLFLIAAAALVLVVALWSGYWLYAAHQVRGSVVAWAQTRRAEGVTLVWDRLAVDGYPFVFRVRIDRLLVSDGRGGPPWELRLPELVGTAPAWTLRHWRIEGAQGLSARLAPSDVRQAVIARAARVEGSVEPGEEGTRIETTLAELAVSAPVAVRAASASARVLLPRRPPASHTDLFGRLTVAVENLDLPKPIAPMGDRVQHLDATFAIKGAIGGGKRREALARWRDAGGVAELESLHLAWDRLAATAEGTFALDADMQPTAALTATLRGWSEILDALGTDGTMKSGDVVLAKLALGLLAKPGPDGRSELSAPVTIQNSTLYIAKIKAARMPRFTWE